MAQSTVYAIYTRQSAAPRDGISSCDAQFDTCLTFAQAECRAGEAWIGERFDDPGVSGATLNRPAMNRLRERIRAGEIGKVYAVALDRFSRRVNDTIGLLKEFEQHGVEMHVAHQPRLLTGAEGRLLQHILAAFAEFERDIISSRIADTRAYLKRHGRRLAGPAPFGYVTDERTKQLIVDKREARRVQAIFRRAAEGQTPAEIARRIDHLGWRTKQWVSQRSGRTIGGGRWTARRVLYLLRNPVYLGEFTDGEGTRPGCHQAIVDPQTFALVQEKLDARRRSEPGARRRIDFPLRGKIICPRCGRPLCTATGTARRANAVIHYRYYRCRSIAGGRPPCRGIQLPAWELERVVRETLAEADIWQQLVCADSDAIGEAEAASLQAIWASLEVQDQQKLLPHVVDRVELRRKNTELRMTLNPQLAKIISDCK